MVRRWLKKIRRWLRAGIGPKQELDGLRAGNSAALNGQHDAEPIIGPQVEVLGDEGTEKYCPILQLELPVIEDCTALSKNKTKRPEFVLAGATMHRLDIGKTPAAIAQAFQDTREFAAGFYTGGLMPYSLIIASTGVFQMLPIKIIGPHALSRWSRETVGIACIGDFRHDRPGYSQWKKARNLCAGLMLMIGRHATLAGHDERAGSSKDPNKECPGKGWPMDQFRLEVMAIVDECGPDTPELRARAEIALLRAGLIL